MAETAPKLSWRERPRLAALAAPVLTVGGVTLAAMPSAGSMAIGTIPMLYLAAVVMAALAGGLLSALIGAALAFVAYDYYFIEPRFSLSVADPAAIMALTVFVGLALATGTLAGRLTEQARAREAQARAMAGLLQFARKLALASGREAVLSTLVHHVGKQLAAEAIFVGHAAGTLTLEASAPRRAPLTAREEKAARLALGGVETEERGYDYHPLVSGNRTMGLIGLQRARQLTPEENDILGGIIDLASVALDRSERARESAAAEAARESGRLQAALLSSISHDLRTPLASITGAATSLSELGDRMDEAARQDLMRLIAEEAGTLNRYVSNLLDITRIEGGALAPKSEPMEIGSVIGRALERVQRLEPGFKAETSLAAGLPPVSGDAGLLEQVLFNVIDNARRHAPSEVPLAIYARQEDEFLVLTVTDAGPGIDEDDLKQVFEKFTRRGPGAGTGLGLAIVRGFVLAMGGTVSVESPAIKKRGTRFTIRLPLEGAEA